MITTMATYDRAPHTFAKMQELYGFILASVRPAKVRNLQEMLLVGTCRHLAVSFELSTSVVKALAWLLYGMHKDDAELT